MSFSTSFPASAEKPQCTRLTRESADCQRVGMRILLDECIPRKLKSSFTGYDCRAVAEEGWTGKKNCELLKLAAEAGFQAFLALDRGIEYQQNLQDRNVAVVLSERNQIGWLTCCRTFRN